MTIYEVVLEGRQNGEDMLTVLHFDITGSDPVDWEAFADNIVSEWMAVLQPTTTANTTYEGVTVRLDIEGSVGLFVPFSTGIVAGTDSDDGQVTQVAMLARKNTGTLTRPTQGRIFHGGISSQYIDNTGNWSGAARAAVQTFWTSLLDFPFGTDNDARMVVKASNPSAPNTVPYNPVDNITIAGIPVVQRRRKKLTGS